MRVPVSEWLSQKRAFFFGFILKEITLLAKAEEAHCCDG